MEQVTVTARLDQARSNLQPSLGAEVYWFGRGALRTIPQGDDTPLNQVLLQAPGVAQDSYGQIHVRRDHDEVQFRLDGVQLPEGLVCGTAFSRIEGFLELHPMMNHDPAGSPSGLVRQRLKS